eukprot:m.132059 g.132059  ORF g.132059 m.132059 type:complete len:117 (+) comp13929_c0_seq6:1321-1671(+)
MASRSTAFTVKPALPIKLAHDAYRIAATCAAGTSYMPQAKLLQASLFRRFGLRGNAAVCYQSVAACTEPASQGAIDGNQYHESQVMRACQQALSDAHRLVSVCTCCSRITFVLNDF